MILGSASDEQKRFFEHMVAVQEVAFEALQPGARCRDVDLAVRRYYEEHELMPYWKHHTGHGIGLRYHEGPFLDSGDSTLLQPGMVLTVEPGLYIAPDAEVANETAAQFRGIGIRIEDDVLVTESGHEILSRDAPKEVEEIEQLMAAADRAEQQEMH